MGDEGKKDTVDELRAKELATRNWIKRWWAGAGPKTRTAVAIVGGVLIILVMVLVGMARR